MSSTVRYLTHPNVTIDPKVDVKQWSLNQTGRARVAALAASLGALAGTTRVVSSAETKAVQTAEPLAAALKVSVEIRPDMHENDRSATGFLPPDVFEDVADRFFAKPTEAVRGWETAKNAQARILREVQSCLAGHMQGDVLIVGHGAVGTLLYCALADLPIDRRYDQGPGGGGNWFQFDLHDRTPPHGWRTIEALSVERSV